MNVSWDSVVIKAKNIEQVEVVSPWWVPSWIYLWIWPSMSTESLQEAKLCAAIGWLRSNKNFNIQVSMIPIYAYVTGGNEQEWKEIAQNPCFNDVEIIPDIFLQRPDYK